MEIIQIVGIGLVAAIIAVTLKSVAPQYALMISILTGTVIFLLIAGKLSEIIDYLGSISGKIGIDFLYLDIMLKIIGISYLAEFGSEICRDAGETSISSKIELAGKVVIFSLSVPVLTTLLQMITSLVP